MPASRFRICLSAAALAGTMTLAGCAGPGGPVTGGEADAKVVAEGRGGHENGGKGGDRDPREHRGGSGHETASARTPVDDRDAGELPGLGPETLAKVPDESRQVLIVTGEAKGSSRSHAVLYRRTPAGWRAGESWSAHNAAKGWSENHHIGDLSSPIGVFTLTDAGGLLPDPGSALPYHRSQEFTVDGTGFHGESLAGSFDYVIAIEYNREPGTSPLDWTRPEGAEKGGGIWLHVDHGGPTQACISLSEAHMKKLLRALKPDRHPVIVMGDARSLQR